MTALGENRTYWSRGPSVLLAAEWSSRGAWDFRLAGEWSSLSAKQVGLVSSETQLRAYGGSLNVLRRLTGHDFEPYSLFGVGVYRLRRTDSRHSPYGNTWAAQIGVGMDGPVRFRIHPFIEARAIVHFTDYATNRDFALMTMILPVMVGVRLR